ncbi:MAG: sulfotransferase [Gammaproteobacteria bacterium]|nr:sulfotransferase [Gammaproteobacteria bacterium]
MQRLLEGSCSQLKGVELDSSGAINATSVGTSPYWLLEGVDLEKHYLHIRLSVVPQKDDPGAYYYCKLYFLEMGQKKFDESHSLTLPITRFGEFDDYNFKCLVFQQKKIVAVRFHPFSHRGRIQIQEFEFRPYAQHPRPELARLSGTVHPLLLSFFSRSGSTLVMKILTQHPEVTGYTKGTHEAHFLRYFSSLYDMIKASHIYSGDHSDGTLLKRLEVLSQHYRPDCVLPKPVEFSQYLDLGVFRSYYARFLTDFLPEMLADMEAPGLQSAKYYIEKHMDGTPFGWTRSMLELFPELKIVMLFRDPRDVLISFDAFRKREPINPLKGGDLAGQVENIMRHYTGRLSLHDEYQDRVFILRYEDLMQKPVEVLLPMLHFLGLDDGEDSLEKMLQPLQNRDLQSRRHITADGKRHSVGRWQHDPQVAVAKLFAAHAGIITKLGYPMHDGR